jgi:hypothetical protein
MQLQFFAERKLGHFNEIYDFSAGCFDDSIAD